MFPPQEECEEKLTRLSGNLQSQEDSVESSDTGISEVNMNGISASSGLIWFRMKRKKTLMVCRERLENTVLVLDGSTLIHSLSPRVKSLFLSVASQCKAVMCCRATPLQKVRVHSCTRYFPQMNQFMING